MCRKGGCKFLKQSIRDASQMLHIWIFPYNLEFQITWDSSTLLKGIDPLEILHSFIFLIFYGFFIDSLPPPPL